LKDLIELLTTNLLRILDLYEVKPCRLANRYKYFEGSYSHYLQAQLAQEA